MHFIADKKLFHRAIMMSGSDLCEWSTVDHIYDTDAREYTKALGRQVSLDSFVKLNAIRVKNLSGSNCCAIFNHYVMTNTITFAGWL